MRTRNKIIKQGKLFLLLMQYVGKAQSFEEVVSFAKDLFPEGFENIEREISEAGEQIRQEANKIFNIKLIMKQDIKFKLLFL
jgi:hypothetical protein